jgi:exosortase A
MRRGFGLTVLLLAVGIAALWPTVHSLAGYWADSDNRTYTHGYLVAAICAWLVWRARPRLNSAPLQPFWPAVVATVACGGLWYVSWVSGIQVGHQVLLPVILVLAVTGGLGLRGGAAVAFPVGYIYFAIPVWDAINHQLQALTTKGVTLLIRATGVPAYIEGNFVHIPSGTFEIAGGCSGLHFFIVALAIAVLYGETDREPLRNRLLLALIAAVMAIVMNWVRVYTIIVNGHLTDMQGYLVRVDHYKFGWVLFAVLLVLYFWIAHRFVPLGAEPASRASSGAAATKKNLVAGLVSAVLAVAVGPALAAVANVRASNARVPELITLPAGAPGWQGPEWTNSPWQPKYPGADVQARAEYRNGDQWVVAYLNAYAHQSQEREMVGYYSDILGTSGWQAVAQTQRTAASSGGPFSYLEVTAAAPQDERWVVGYLYEVGGRTFTSGLASKLYYGRAVLSGRPQSGVVAAAARCAEDDCSAASNTVNQFLAAHADALANTLRKGP